ncbi:MULTISPECIES: hypothetical protein [Actinoplanes]|uniref:hypothetical protein n=1 Tax=Actinoplanes TaxID=1865 RepID=UPI000AC0F07A|nr:MULTISPECIES: hypothetical protein [Actinoplanes]GLY02422.1 hypothetical protein Acsp01_28010 [Actinoplanes sp. NBRC 101535]
MSFSTNMADVLFRAIRLAAVPQPDAGGNAPDALINMVKLGLNLIAWAGTAAGVAGVLITGTVMAISHRRGETSEHMSRLGMVLGGCILVAVAGPIVQFVFDFNAAK